ncbi:hypothetical protein ACG2F4_19180 [Halalkalibaculum sp. DA3122]
MKRRLAEWMWNAAPHVPGSRARILWQENVEWLWEGKPIKFTSW